MVALFGKANENNYEQLWWFELIISRFKLIVDTKTKFFIWVYLKFVMITRCQTNFRISMITKLENALKREKTRWFFSQQKGTSRSVRVWPKSAVEKNTRLCLFGVWTLSDNQFTIPLTLSLHLCRFACL